MGINKEKGLMSYTEWERERKWGMGSHLPHRWNVAGREERVHKPSHPFLSTPFMSTAPLLRLGGREIQKNELEAQRWQDDRAQAFYPNRWVRVFNKINRPIITMCTWHHRLQLRVQSDSSFLKFLFSLISFPCPEPINSLSSHSVSGLALIMWNGLYTAEKIVIQWTLLSEACYFAVQFLGD